MARSQGRTLKPDQFPDRGYHYRDCLGDSWNFDGMIEDAQLDRLSGRPIAQGHAMPTWKRADEFKAARQHALAALDGR